MRRLFPLPRKRERGEQAPYPFIKTSRTARATILEPGLEVVEPQVLIGVVGVRFEDRAGAGTVEDYQILRGIGSANRLMSYQPSL